MKRNWLMAGLMVCALLLPLTGLAQQPQYTRAEYDAFQAAATEQNPQQKIRLLDEFVAQYPQSTLMPYVVAQYFQTYVNLQNHAKVIEYSDKMLELGDQFDTQTRTQAIWQRTVSFLTSFNERDANSTQKLARAREVAQEGIRLINALERPENVTPEQFNEQKRIPLALFQYAVGFTAFHQKDYNAAIQSLRRALELNPSEEATYQRLLGLAYLQKEPPSHNDGFWALARAIALKAPGEAQLRTYLRAQILRYQLTACDHLVDQQLNELLALAGTSAERPNDYRIPSEDDLRRAREATTNLVVALQEGGERSQLVFLATCGLPFPEVGAKVFESEPTEDGARLRVFHAASQEEIEAATAPNMEVVVAGQPEAARLEKDDWVRFSGTLSGYEPEPFLVRWTEGKINPDDLPAAGRQPGKRGKRP